ncbi:MAG: TonB-dependent Receptor Plug Domain protein [Bacteroidetes bacterium]|nr:TonB-dependent Receptor Plug Domain protein [Bacteroidota bacterium]
MKEKILLWMICLLMSTDVAWTQTPAISGTVISGDDNQPIIGATILVKGTKLGTVTNTEGHFSLSNVPKTATTLVVSYVGMKSEEFAIKANLQIVMKADSKVMDEVMVVAYGTAKKSSYSGSAALVKADAIKDLPSTSFQNALNGKVAGLQITSATGQAAQIRMSIFHVLQPANNFCNRSGRFGSQHPYPRKRIDECQQRTVVCY